MSVDWKRMMQGAAGLLTAAALCVAGMTIAAPGAVAADGDGTSGAGQAGGTSTVAETTVTASNAEEFVDALNRCTSGITQTVTVAGDIDLEQRLSQKHIACALTVISDGSAHRFTWTTASSLFWIEGGGSLTIGKSGDVGANMLTFTSTDGGTTKTGPLTHNYGTFTIEGGTFTQLHSGSGPVSLNDGTMIVKGGTFSNNIADGNGGAIVSNNKLTIQGDALFENNRSKANQWTAGGGAVWAGGELRVKKDANGNAPTFTGNQSLTEEPGTDGKLGKGGAGGAIFFNTGTLYLTGGTFTNNRSGYLGGAVYTEEGSTTYVGKAVAFDNTAGHFGGGLWFCPSGNSAASKGGNIALFDNHVGSPNDDGSTIDANTDENDKNSNNPKNISSYSDPNADMTQAKADTTQAGADLAIMNPYWKWSNGWLGDKSSNQFQLLDTWFIDRSADAKAVTWTWDNVPMRESSGYHDSWLPTATSNATHQPVNQGIGAVLATTKDPKNGTEQAPGVLQLQAKLKTDKPDTGDITWIRTGVALKATVEGKDEAARNALKDQAKAKAQVTMSGNEARLSGGAFGSNGVVLFDTPYSMNWEKIDMGTNDKLDDTDQPVTAGSTWTLTATKLDAQDGVKLGDELPYNDADMRPTECVVAPEQKDDCWSIDPTNGKYVVDIVDNGSRDNDPAVGAFGIENLAPGTYTLTEKEAPAGFQKTSNTYKFTIEKAVGGVITVTPTLSSDKKDGTGDADKGPLGTGNRIGNKRVTGKIDWTKVSATIGTRIDGSEWEITHTAVAGATGDKNVSFKVVDCKAVETTLCTVDGKEGSAKLLDQDPSGGGFDVDIAGTTNGAYDWPDGTYTIKETKAPAGYLLPADATARSATFTITTGTDSAANATVRKVEWTNGAGQDTTSGHQFTNQPTEVTWEKVDSIDSRALAGSSWTLTQTQDGSGNPVTGDNSSWTITDCLTSDSNCGTQVPSDSDNSADGKFGVRGLKAGTYTLQEATAPEGYELSTTVYEFTIADGSDGSTTVGTTVQIKIQNGGTDVTGNKIPNTRKPITALPFTGGRSGWDWLVVGGGLALAATVTGLITWRLRRREL